MKYVQISTHADGWGKTILFDKHRKLQEQGIESYVFWARGEHDQDEYMIQIASFLESCIDAIQTRFDGKAGFHSKSQTKRLLRKLDEINPDVVHLHVLIGYYINVEMLFEWLASHRCQVIWTLHDCWAFTGHCIHFTYASCNQWITGCGKVTQCPQTDTYPPTICKKNVYRNYLRKKELFTMLPVDRMKIIVPSTWLGALVRESFLCKYQVTVERNEIDRRVFKPLERGVFRLKHGLEKSFIVLGVSTSWSERKGLSDFIRLANDLDSNFAIVLIGLNRHQIKCLSDEVPENLILLPKTNSIHELVDAYSAADVYFNPTREDTFPTVNLEAEACGTPVITYNVGGCSETVSKTTSKVVSNYGDAVASIIAIYRKSNQNSG